MLSLMRARALSFLILSLTLTGCEVCTFEQRTIETAGVAGDPLTPDASVAVTLFENRGSIQGQSFHSVITGSLKGHVISAAFKDSADPTHVLLDLPIAGADRPDISDVTAQSATGAHLAGFHDILAQGRGIVELQTDLSSSPVIRIAMVVTSNGDWTRPACG
jgi:hypothetical protein